MKNIILFLGILASLSYSLVSTVPGIVQSDWVGNSLSFRELISPNLDTAELLSHKWVQQNLDDMWVHSDGTVYARSNYDESARVCGIYKDGDLKGQIGPCLNAQMGQNGAMIGDGDIVYITSGILWGDASKHGWGVVTSNKDGTWGWRQNGAGANGSFYVVRNTGWVPYNKAFLGFDKVSKEMFVCDSTDTVYVFNTNTGDPNYIAKFYLPNITGIAANDNGKLWIISNGILGLYSNRGAFQNKTITKALKPTKIHYSIKNELIVWDDSTFQLYMFSNAGSSNQIYRTFGIKDGIYSTKGKFQNNTMYPNLKGIGVDGKGKLYLGWGWWPTPTNTDIRAYNTNGTLNWRLSCNTFVQVPGFDPRSDGKDLFYMQTRHSIDYTKDVGKKLSQTGYTYDRRQDNGVSPGGGTLVRWIQNKRFLYRSYCDQCGDGFTIWKAKDSFYIPAGQVHQSNIYSWWVDTTGDVWSGYFDVKRYTINGINGSGNPVYDTLNPTIYSAPANLGLIRRMSYDPANDIMYLTGFNDQHPWVVGVDDNGIGLVMGKYSNWKSGSPTNDWLVTLPYDYSGSFHSMISFWAEGDYIFIGTFQRMPQTIEVYKKSDGTKVGEILPGNEIGGNQYVYSTWAHLGWIDMVWGIQATKRSNGEYVILVEDDVQGKTVMYRWCPTTCDMSK